MATLCKPAVRVPEHVVTMEDMLAMAEQSMLASPNSRWRYA